MLRQYAKGCWWADRVGTKIIEFEQSIIFFLSYFILFYLNVLLSLHSSTRCLLPSPQIVNGRSYGLKLTSTFSTSNQRSYVSFIIILLTRLITNSLCCTLYHSQHPIWLDWMLELWPTTMWTAESWATKSVWGLCQWKGLVDPWFVSLFVVACFLYRATAGQQCFHVSQFRRAESLFLFHLLELVLVSLGGWLLLYVLLLLLLNIKQLVMVNHYYEQRRLLRLRFRLHLRLRLCPHCAARSRTSGHMSVRFIWNKEKETNLMFYSFLVENRSRRSKCEEKQNISRGWISRWLCGGRRRSADRWISHFIRLMMLRVL